jgi:Acetylglutamate semialdehyde dehydrogenase
MKDSIKVGVIGATGYVGIELIKILSKHPKVKVLYLCAQKSIGKSISNFDKNIKKKSLPRISKINKIDWKKIDVVFSALPNGEAQKISKIIPENVKLIDLSADFRLNNHKTYKEWYGIDHKAKNLIKHSIYSLTEFFKNKIKKYRIISCPGCLPTSISFTFIPFN